MNLTRIIYKIALAYYEDGLTQQEIAYKYGMSRIKVSRMLARAIQEKIVQINITPPENHYSDLERQLEKSYGLKESVIVEGYAENREELINSMGRAAAGYLHSIIQGHEVMGLTWGRALLSTINALKSVSFPKLQVVQMLGGLGEPEAEYHGADLTRRMAQLFSTKPRLIHAPGIVKSSDLCQELMNDLQVKNTLDLASKADIALVGIGLFGPGSPILKSEKFLVEKDKKLLTSLGVIGDISFRFFNGEGEFISSEIDERVVGLSVGQLKNIPRIIAIAGGQDKYLTIRAALKGKLVHVLITDHLTAERLLKENI